MNLSDINFIEAFKMSEEEISKAGEAYAKAKGAKYFLDKQDKIVWSKTYLKHKAGKTIKDAESLAYTDPDYLEQITLTSKAIEKESNARKEYERALAKQESYRSLCSQSTAQIKLQ